MSMYTYNRCVCYRVDCTWRWFIWGFIWIKVHVRFIEQKYISFKSSSYLFESLIKILRKAHWHKNTQTLGYWPWLGIGAKKDVTMCLIMFVINLYLPVFRIRAFLPESGSGLNTQIEDIWRIVIFNFHYFFNYKT